MRRQAIQARLGVREFGQFPRSSVGIPRHLPSSSARAISDFIGGRLAWCTSQRRHCGRLRTRATADTMKYLRSKACPLRLADGPELASAALLRNPLRRRTNSFGGLMTCARLSSRFPLIVRPWRTGGARPRLLRADHTFRAGKNVIYTRLRPPAAHPKTHRRRRHPRAAAQERRAHHRSGRGGSGATGASASRSRRAAPATSSSCASWRLHNDRKRGSRRRRGVPRTS